MKILVIEDKASRLRRVSKALTGITDDNEEGLLNEALVFSADTKEKRKSFCKEIRMLANKSLFELYYYIYKIIEEENIDIVFTDLSLKEDVEKGITTGEMLIKKVRENTLHKKIPIIAYSRNLDDSSELHNPYETLGASTHFVPIEKTTKDARKFYYKFKGYLDFTNLKVQSKEYSQRTYKYNLSVICALKKEYDEVVKFLDGQVLDMSSLCGDRSSSYGYMTNEKNGIVVKVLLHWMKNNDFYGKYGRSEVNTALSGIKQNCTPQYIAMTGIMAGYKPRNIRLGNVLIADKAFLWDNGRHEENHIEEGKDDTEKYTQTLKKYVDHLYKNYFSEENNKKNILKIATKKYLTETEKVNHEIKETKEEHNNIQRYKTYVCTVATGDHIVNNEKKFSDIVELRKDVLGLEMEISELYLKTKEYEGIETIAMKAVVDYGDGNKNKNWQEIGSYLSAYVMYTFFMEIVFPSRLKEAK